MGVLTTSDQAKPQKLEIASPKLSNQPVWWIKLTHWEFWPFNVFYLPIFIYAGWLMLRTRSFFFFSASNPGIENAGMLGESKFKILEQFDPLHKPQTFLLQPNASSDEVQELLKAHDLKFPFILKPDIGERGWMVKKINTDTQLKNYLKEVKVPFLLQEYVHSPVELGVFYYRMPDEKIGHISSVVLKEMMTVTGDGTSDVKSLLLENPRSVITLSEIEKTSGDVFQYVPEHGEEVEVVPIGNHCRGTTFLDGNHLINEKMTRAIDEVAKQIPGFYFGRFDLRCDSLAALEKGNFKIFELNGSGAEPAHIYQPGYSLFKAYRELAFHLKIMFRIARANHKNGVPYMTVKEGLQLMKFLKGYNKLKN